MSKDLPLVVAGVGRCGSSLLMQMLLDGGMDLTGTAVWPFCEDGATLGLPEDAEWMRGLTGRDVVKILNPGRYTPPPWFRCKAIWVERNIKEQAKSWVKFGERHNHPINRTTAESLTIKRTRAGKKVMKKLAGEWFGTVRFEAILHNPAMWADIINRTWKLGLDVDKMARAVTPRAPECLPGFLEEMLGG